MLIYYTQKTVLETSPETNNKNQSNPPNFPASLQEQPLKYDLKKNVSTNQRWSSNRRNQKDSLSVILKNDKENDQTAPNPNVSFISSSGWSMQSCLEGPRVQKIKMEPGIQKLPEWQKRTLLRNEGLFTSQYNQMLQKTKSLQNFKSYQKERKTMGLGVQEELPVNYNGRSYYNPQITTPDNPTPFFPVLVDNADILFVRRQNAQLEKEMLLLLDELEQSHQKDQIERQVANRVRENAEQLKLQKQQKDVTIQKLLQTNDQLVRLVRSKCREVQQLARIIKEVQKNIADLTKKLQEITKSKNNFQLECVSLREQLHLLEEVQSRKMEAATQTIKNGYHHFQVQTQGLSTLPKLQPVTQTGPSQSKKPLAKTTGPPLVDIFGRKKQSLQDKQLQKKKDTQTSQTKVKAQPPKQPIVATLPIVAGQNKPQKSLGPIVLLKKAPQTERMSQISQKSNMTTTSSWTRNTSQSQFTLQDDSSVKMPSQTSQRSSDISSKLCLNSIIDKQHKQVPPNKKKSSSILEIDKPLKDQPPQAMEKMEVLDQTAKEKQSQCAIY